MALSRLAGRSSQRVALHRQVRASRPRECRRRARGFATAGAAGELYGREHELHVVASLAGALAEGAGGVLAVAWANGRSATSPSARPRQSARAWRSAAGRDRGERGRAVAECAAESGHVDVQGGGAVRSPPHSQAGQLAMAAEPIVSTDAARGDVFTGAGSRLNLLSGQLTCVRRPVSAVISLETGRPGRPVTMRDTQPARPRLPAVSADFPAWSTAWPTARRA